MALEKFRTKHDHRAKGREKESSWDKLSSAQMMTSRPSLKLRVDTLVYALLDDKAVIRSGLEHDHCSGVTLQSRYLDERCWGIFFFIPLNLI